MAIKRLASAALTRGERTGIRKIANNSSNRRQRRVLAAEKAIASKGKGRSGNSPAS